MPTPTNHAITPGVIVLGRPTGGSRAVGVPVDAKRHDKPGGQATVGGGLIGPARTASAIVATSAMAPTPTSPQARRLACGGTSTRPGAWRAKTSAASSSVQPGSPGRPSPWSASELAEVTQRHGALPHQGVHRGGEHHRPGEIPGAEHAGQEVVGEAEGELGQGVGVERGDDQQVGPLAERDVQDRIAAPIARAGPLVGVAEERALPRARRGRARPGRRSGAPARSRPRGPRAPPRAGRRTAAGVRTAPPSRSRPGGCRAIVADSMRDRRGDGTRGADGDRDEPTGGGRSAPLGREGLDRLVDASVRLFQRVRAELRISRRVSSSRSSARWVSTVTTALRSVWSRPVRSSNSSGSSRVGNEVSCLQVAIQNPPWLRGAAVARSPSRADPKLIRGSSPQSSVFFSVRSHVGGGPRNSHIVIGFDAALHQQLSRQSPQMILGHESPMPGVRCFALD